MGINYSQRKSNTMENTKENNIIDFQTERRESRINTEQEKKGSFEQDMEWGDIWSLPSRKEFQDASSVVQFDMMGKALDRRVELNNKTFIEILRVDPEKAGVFLDNAIKPLRKLQNALINAQTDEQIQQNPFAEDSFEEESA